MQQFLFLISWRSITFVSLKTLTKMPLNSPCWSQLSLHPLCTTAIHVLMFPPSLSHNAEMGRLSLTGTRMRTGTLDEAQHLLWPVHASRMGCFSSAGLQRGHVPVHSMFSIPTADDYLLPTVIPQTRVPH